MRSISWLSEFGHPAPDAIFALPKAIYFLSRYLPELRDFNTNAVEGRVGLYFWWECVGSKCYSTYEWAPRQEDLDFLNNLHDQEILDRYGAALFYWMRDTGPSVLNRPSLRERIVSYPIESGETSEFALPNIFNVIQSFSALDANLADLLSYPGKLLALRWWQDYGSREYGRFPIDLSSTLFELEQLFELKIENEVFLIPNLVYCLSRTRSDLIQAFDLQSIASLLYLLRWWESDGIRTYPRIFWSSSAIISYLEAHVEFLGVTAPRIIQKIFERKLASTDVDNAATSQLFAEFIRFSATECLKPYPFFSNRTINEVEVDSHWSFADNSSDRELGKRGVDIVGFPQGVLGLGEDARMLGHALQKGGYDVGFINAPMDGPTKIDTTVLPLLRDRQNNKISVFCLPPPEMIRLSLAGGRHLLTSHVYKIGAMPWELPQWPIAFSGITYLLDEIWAQSRFVQATLSKMGHDQTFYMPMAVDIPAPQQNTRNRFGLDKNAFLFYLMFDGSSWLSRKNPVGGVHAFQKAFPKTEHDIHLVIKAMNIRADDAQWRVIQDIAAADPRIVVISEQLSRQDTIDFMASCDAYISLHRSEGFGRVIAESMLLGQPTIVTNFSGNTDFSNENTAYLVDGDLVPLSPSDYLFAEGQYWCDPDLDQAALQMQRVVNNKMERETLALRGQALMRSEFSISAASHRYTERIGKILDELL